MARVDSTQLTENVRALLRSMSEHTGSRTRQGEAQLPQSAPSAKSDSVRVTGEALQRLTENLLSALSDQTRSSVQDGAVSKISLDMVLADDELRSRLVETLTRSEAVRPLATALRDPELQPLTARLLAQAEFSGVSREILMSPDTQPPLGTLLASPVTREDAAAMLQRLGSPVEQAEIVVRAESEIKIADLAATRTGRSVIAQAVGAESDASRLLIENIVVEAQGAQRADTRSEVPDWLKSLAREPLFREAIVQNAQQGDVASMRIVDAAIAGEERVAVVETRARVLIENFRAGVELPREATDARWILEAATGPERSLTNAVRAFAARPEVAEALVQSLRSEPNGGYIAETIQRPGGDQVMLALVRNEGGEELIRQALESPASRQATEQPIASSRDAIIGFMARVASNPSPEIMRVGQAMLSQSNTARAIIQHAVSGDMSSSTASALVRSADASWVGNVLAQAKGGTALTEMLTKAGQSNDGVSGNQVNRLVEEIVRGFENSYKPTANMRTQPQAAELKSFLSNPATTGLIASNVRDMASAQAARTLNHTAGLAEAEITLETFELLRSESGREQLGRMFSQYSHSAPYLLKALNRGGNAQVFTHAFREPQALESLSRTVVLQPELLADFSETLQRISTLAEAPGASRLMVNDDFRQALVNALQNNEARRGSTEWLLKAAATKQIDLSRQPESVQNAVRESLSALAGNAARGDREAVAFLRSVLTEPNRRALLQLTSGESAQSVELRQSLAQLAASSREYSTAIAELRINVLPAEGASRPSSENLELQLSRLAENGSARESQRFFREILDQNLVRQVFEPAASRKVALEILAKPGMESAAARLLVEGEVQAQLSQVLQGRFRNSELSAHVNRDALGRMLSDPAMRNEYAQSVQSNAGNEVGAETTRVLEVLRQVQLSGNTGGRAAVESLLVAPENRQALLSMLSGERGLDSARQLNLILADSPRTAAELVQSESGRQTVSQLLAQTESRENTLRVLISASEHSIVARQLLATENAQRGMAEVLMQRPGSSQSAQILTYLAERAESQNAAAVLREIASYPRSQQVLADLITQPNSSRDALQFLSRIPEPEPSARLLQAPEVKQAVVQPLSQSQRNASIEVFLKPDSALESVSRQILLQPENATLASRILQSPAGQGAVERWIQSPELRAQTLNLLAKTELTDARVALLDRPAVRSTLVGMIASRSEAELALRVLSRINPDSIQAREIGSELARQESIERSISSVLQRPDGQGRSDALRVLAWPSLREIAHRAVIDSATRQALKRVLENVQPAETTQNRAATATAREALNRLLSLGSSELSAALKGTQSEAISKAADLAGRSNSLPALNRSDTAMLLEVLARPEMADFARDTLAIREVRGLMAKILATPLPDSVEAQRTARDSEAVLRILSRPENLAAAREVFSDQLVARRVPELLANGETRKHLLRLMANEGFQTAAREITGSVDLQVAVKNLITQASSRNDVIRLMQIPALAEVVVRDIAAAPQDAEIRVLLEVPEMRTVLMRTIALSPEGSDALLSLMREGATRALLREAIANSPHSAAIQRQLAVPEIMEQVVNLLSNTEQQEGFRSLLQLAQMKPFLHALAEFARQSGNNSILNYLQGLVTGPQPGANAAGQMVNGNAGTHPHGNLNPYVTESSGRRPESSPLMQSPANGQSLMVSSRSALTDMFSRPRIGQLHPSLRPGGATFEHLYVSLEGLERVSTDRSQNVLRTLGAIADLEPRNLPEALRQMTRGIDHLSTRLRMKGGLALGQPEPKVQGMLISLRFDNLSSQQFASMTRSLLAQGVDIQNVARASNGAAQLSVAVGEASAGAFGRVLPHYIPGQIAYANLRSGDMAAFWPLLALPEQGTDQSRNSNGRFHYWPKRSDGASSPGQYTRQEIEQLLEVRDLRAGRAAGRESAVAAMRRRPAEIANTLRSEGVLTFAYNYNYALLFPWFDPTVAASDMAMSTAGLTETGEIIPTFLDLISDEPLLLGYTPDEIMIPGTDIPLILRPDEAVDTMWTYVS